MTDFPGGFTYRPISEWPGERTARPRSSPFDSPWSSTLETLRRELRALSARDVIIELDMPASNIRIDGMPRANATPATPGVILSFESKHGPLRYACDAFWNWQANVRAIALGLEALRRVERYGITRRGEQYAGFARLGAGSGVSKGVVAYMTVETAAGFMEQHAVEAKLSGHPAFTAAQIMTSALRGRAAYRIAAKNLHPDTGGNRQSWDRLQQAKEVLERHWTAAGVVA
jgi:hypothetical protein